MNIEKERKNMAKRKNERKNDKRKNDERTSRTTSIPSAPRLSSGGNAPKINCLYI